MDFIEGIPISERKFVILVVLDRLTKYNHIVSLHHPYTASSVTREFISNVFKLHGLPASITSNRDKIFTSHFWKDLFKALRTQLNLSTAYHPQTDGKTERVNSYLENYLRCMCSHQPKKWHQWLPLAEWWYNTNYHTELKMSPFQALYGYIPPQIDFPSTAITSVTDKIGDVSYKLNLPSEARIHPIFHVSQLKKQIGTSLTPSPTLPTLDTDGQILVIRAAALDSRTVIRKGVFVPQLLIKWTIASNEYIVKPPRLVRPYGRTRTQRIKDIDDPGYDNRNAHSCERCRLYENHRTTCKGAPDGCESSTAPANCSASPNSSLAPPVQSIQPPPPPASWFPSPPMLYRTH
ncbi:uncharacterized protein LOC113360194 [Papaver somniferum]|uniref:uncharacterized protein LOC113360194 n=1 Tax=Papaver somniferum TaxID=3469 RepID=UPI000E6F6171|nr:uncharacterized protein LOC113360194 [Papaver somniferum]